MFSVCRTILAVAFTLTFSLVHLAQGHAHDKGAISRTNAQQIDPGTCLLGLSRDGVILCPKPVDTVKIWFIRYWNQTLKEEKPDSKWRVAICPKKVDSQTFESSLRFNYAFAALAFPEPFPKNAHRAGVDQAYKQLQKKLC